LLSPNPGAERRTQAGCYNGQRDGDETGIDCGGSCPLQDCCANRAWDANLAELGVDCDGTCARACQPADRLDRWTQTNGPWLEYIRRIRFDPGDASTLIVASNTGSGVAKSTDRGQTWHLISGPDQAGGISPMNVFGLAMDPVDKNTLYAGTANGRLYHTVDGGATWSLLWEYTEVDDALWTVEVDPNDRDRLLVGTGDYNISDGRLFLSEDRGLTWDLVLDVDPGDDLDNGFISHIAFDPAYTQTLYLTTGIGDFCGAGPPGFSYGIWKSEDGGLAWFPINNGLSDLTVSHVVVDPTQPQTLYAAVGCVDDTIQLPGNVFKSTDGGSNWQPLTVSPVQPVTRVGLHPQDPQKVYAMGYAGVFYSEDGGTNWSQINETFKSAVYTFVYEHAFSPDLPSTMYIGTYAGGIIKTIDGGYNWFEVNGLRHEGEVLANSYGIAMDPTDPDSLYATTIGGLHRTTDGGESWAFIGQDIFQHLRQVGLDPTNPQRLYVSGDASCCWTSHDAGQTWSHVAVHDSLSGGNFAEIAVDPFSPNRILVGTSLAADATFVRSLDHGQTWDVVSLDHYADANAIAYHPSISGTVFAGLGPSPERPRLAVSEDGGGTWQDAAPGLNLLTVYQMAQADGRILAATNGSGVYTRWPGPTPVWERTSSVSHGNQLVYITRLVASPHASDALLAFDKSELALYRTVGPLGDPNPWGLALRLVDASDDLYGLAYDAFDPNRAYATTRLGRFWRSTNAGETWVQSNAGLPGEAVLRGLAADQSAPGQLYAGQAGTPGRLHSSTNGGDTWRVLNEDLTFATIHAFVRHPADPDVAYAGAWGGGTWKTENGGLSWTLLSEAPASAAALALDPQHPETVYATDRTQPTLWQSKDGGQTWWRRFDAGEAYSRLQALAVDPHRPDTVYVSAFEKGGYGLGGSLFRVSGSGYTEITSGLPRVAISLFALPDQPGVLLASTHVYGLYRSGDSGQSWQLVEDGLPRVGFNAIARDPYSGTLYGGACSGSFPEYMRPGLPDGDDEPGIYRSRDGGLMWEQVLGGPVGKGLAFAPGAIYAAAGSGVYLSTDGGDTWLAQVGGPSLGFSGVSMGTGQVYVPTLGGGVHRAAINADQSLTWSGSGGPRPEIHDVQVTSVPGQPGTLFATSFPGGVFKSTDSGGSWQEANFGLPGFTLPDPERNGYYTLALNPANPDNLYLGIYGYGVYRSDDGAATWLPANTGLGNRFVYSLLVEENGAYIWAGTNDGVQSLWRSATGTPGRLSWSAAPDYPWGEEQVTSIIINPEDPAKMALAAFPGGVFAAGDGAEHWYELSNNLQLGKLRTHGVGFEDGYYQLAVDPLDPRHWFLGTYSGRAYETRDSGQSWSRYDEGLIREGSIYAFEVAADGTRLYVSQKAGGVLRRALDPAHPQTRVVAGTGEPCTTGSHYYGTVGEALEACNWEDTVVVCPGSYNEEVVVDRSVRLESWAGPSQTYLRSAHVSTSGVRLAGFLLRSLEVGATVDAQLLGNYLVTYELYLPVVLRDG
jgi:photosystem II stability/assembly factor-like uncharacterized protein